ncbi:hypothetical protein EV182_000868 [Spiromyces aspiralis]|uniref:Uncharacterized protein n=1 Tax=Spiromyces aspiralis TaxID=68401 RepID=A0ACC1HGF0_9FUNG|nr:hypothetical protein EV182_000868 [Spiromyces aspiralis]
MEYFQALGAAKEAATDTAQQPTQLSGPPPSAATVNDIVEWLGKTSDTLFYYSESDEPVRTFHMARDVLATPQTEQLPLPPAEAFAQLVDVTPAPLSSYDDDTSLAAKGGYQDFFRELSDQHKTLGQEARQRIKLLEEFFRAEVERDTPAAYYRIRNGAEVGIWIVLARGSSLVGLQTKAIET